ncbi:NnrU family protein [Aliagarivorans marinus]|uniref:NnrU family protein n=1 Tax=Aliagarivorans marinus TaxID=561965 RepID=UPI00047E74A7|nr:NnrU family protein [Aliagarivorans marinus]
MMWLLLGMVLFLTPHILTHTHYRALLVERMGKHYQGVYALVALAGLLLLFWGHGQAEYQHLYVLSWHYGARHLCYGLVLSFFVLLAAMFIPCNLRRRVHHPMLTGFVLWAVGHLLVNGDLASVLLFATIGLYALVSLVLLLRKGKLCELPAQPWWKDLLVFGLGVVLYVVFVSLHGPLFGIALR